VEDRAAYDPSLRMKLAKLGKLTPESVPPQEQLWHSYPAVEMPSAEAVIAALTKPETWPDYTTEIGRFTPLRAHNRLLLFTHEGKAWVRAAGTSGPMPWHINQAYRVAGREAQHAYWGQGNVVAQSLLHQLALRIGPKPT
jgi:hypothetical protein